MGHKWDTMFLLMSCIGLVDFGIYGHKVAEDDGFYSIGVYWAQIKSRSRAIVLVGVKGVLFVPWGTQI